MTDKFPIHLLEKETYSFKKTQIWAYMYASNDFQFKQKQNKESNFIALNFLQKNIFSDYISVLGLNAQTSGGRLADL